MLLHVVLLFLALDRALARVPGDVTTTQSQVLPTGNRTKLWHCRDDLPGCCPKLLKQVFFLHIEKTGGTATRRAMRSALAEVRPRLGGGGAPCAYLEHTAYDCHPAMDRPQQPECNWRNRAYYRDWVTPGRHFRGGRCSLTSAHHDHALFEAFPPGAKGRTLLAVNLREPVARTVSHYHMLRRFNATGDASAAEYGVRNPRGQSRTRNKQARMLAGDFCCVNGTAMPYDDPGILDRAAKRLDRYCVVGLMERLDESLAYLRFVLGLPPLQPPSTATPTGGPTTPTVNDSAAAAFVIEGAPGQRRRAALELNRQRGEGGEARGEGEGNGEQGTALQAQPAKAVSDEVAAAAAVAASGGGGAAAQGRRKAAAAPHEGGADARHNYGPLDPADAQALADANQLDVQLYGMAVRRFEEQMAAMRAAGYPVAGGGGPVDLASSSGSSSKPHGGTR
ncbi:hypothetical protein HYH03_014985 [Edaphochlamys debaryana]|uniref:Uncharacterized protein n=1 Tax=Edaphochlamys debaryana TaxID=47281 RepID=A0A835XV49_9CHLO|nr:hypothetical protein HYH03_014985 [Edaphochlamys debaryana]|eukprot:KAG2486409.1 hypothetical protein HYH03_014985 [Edaphochlamys debaryana]